MSNNSEEHDHYPVKVRMKMKTVLECVPGTRADGEPVSILALSDNDSVETIALTVRDSKTLVIALLISVSTAGNTFAQFLIDEYFVKRDDDPVGPFDGE